MQSTSGMLWCVVVEWLVHRTWALVAKSLVCGLNPSHDTCVLEQGTCFVKVGEVVLSALPARLLVNDTQAYILTDCKGGNPVSAPGIGGNSPWENSWFVAHTLKWPSGLVCLATCIKINLGEINHHSKLTITWPFHLRLKSTLAPNHHHCCTI